MKFTIPNLGKQLPSLVILFGFLLQGQFLLAQSTDEPSGSPIELEKFVILGSKSGLPRSPEESPVPIDIVSAQEIASVSGTADITDNLRALIPSFTATPATGDGSAFVRPTSLRGMAPDQSLVLVNGKRRHRSSLVQFFAPAAGNGAHGVDIGMIPSIALRNIEVLRDGASAQYGSDAIAGVINFALRDDRKGGELRVQVGSHYEGETSTNFAGNIGLPLGENGFVNLSLEHSDNPALSRGTQRTVGQALVDAGVAGVGADSPFGDAPFVQTWGRPETSGTRFILNSGLELDNGNSLYAFGNFADTDGRYRFFYRSPTHSAITGFLANNPQITTNPWPAGFTPFLDGAQADASLVTGIRSASNQDLRYDFSVGWGRNELAYFLNNSLNPDLPVNGSDIQQDFKMGGYEQEEINLNADFSRTINSNTFLSWGAEWREETFTVVAGEANAIVGAGTSGLRAAGSADAGDHSRDNYSVYADLEHTKDRLLTQFALRFEDFSDFGSTINGKIALRYQVNETTALRTSVSSGFHAPTPGQANVQTTITTFDGATGLQTEEGLVPADSPAALSVGGKALEEEKSLNLSLGMTTNLGPFSLTVDAYQIQVDDRIYRTGDIAVPGTANSTISFYTNAMNIESRGVDVVLSGEVEWSNYTTNVIFAYNHNEIEVVKQSPVGNILPVSAATIEDIENNYPDNRFSLTTLTKLSDQWDLMLRANFYGKHYDERGTIGDTSGNASWELDATVLIDLEVGYDLNDRTRIAVGAANLFDTFPDVVPDDGIHANRQSVGLPYPRRTPVNYEGGFYYAKTSFKF